MAARWMDIDLTGALWTKPQTKSGKSMTVRLTVLALRLLESRSKASKSEWAFPSKRSISGHVAHIGRAWDRIRSESGLSDIRPHDLRRSLASWMASQNVSPIIIGEMLGHAPGSRATAVYARLAKGVVRTAAEQATQALLQAGKRKKLVRKRLKDYT